MKKQTIFFKNNPKIIGGYSIVGPKESKSTLEGFFDYGMREDTFGEKTFEKTEKRMMELAITGCIEKAGIKPSDVEMILSGDLLNQIITSSFAARDFNSGFIGLFGACSTMAEGLGLSACLIDAGHFCNVVCSASSHFSTAERQFRFPLELGNQRPPTSQWTVTGAGACVVSCEGEGPSITSATFGKVVDLGIADVNNMGAAMAPAAADTLVAVFRETKTKAKDYDLIVTGDLGKLGSEILLDLLEKENIKLGINYKDCGQIIFDKTDKVFMGGSGAGCSSVVLNSYILKKMKMGELNKVLFVATGALLSTLSSQQGESIPGIAHAIVIENVIKEKF